MPQHAAKNGGRAKPPGGRRASGAEVQARLDFADKMLRDGHSRADVVGAMTSKFGVSMRAADSYIARARDRWAEESKGVREVERVASLNRLDRISGKAEKRGQFGAAVSAEKLRAQVTGLLAPQAVEVKATVETAKPAEPDLSDAAIAEELSAIASVLSYMVKAGHIEVTGGLIADVRELAEAVGLLPASAPARAFASPSHPAATSTRS
ncbi:MAG: hypothetical protein KF895_13505, partial [Parvibaculum sp.]|nr:hypothetical protein [Parvibaculum sp.]